MSQRVLQMIMTSSQNHNLPTYQAQVQPKHAEEETKKQKVNKSTYVTESKTAGSKRFDHTDKENIVKVASQLGKPEKSLNQSKRSIV